MSDKIVKTKKTKVNFSSLKEAFADGKFLPNEKCKVYFERTLNKRTSIHEGTVLSIKDNVITLYDETIGQQYTVDVNEKIPVIKF